MNREFKLRDRVRVRRACRSYQVGDKGAVLDGPSSYADTDEKSYVVAMDKDGPGSTSTIFDAAAIELDA
jgi:hypothetical protein